MSALITYPRFKAFVPGTGSPAANYTVTTFLAGTSTFQAVYTDSGLLVPWTNPVLLDANGEATIYADPSISYKLQFKDPFGANLWTVDNVQLGAGTGGSSALGGWKNYLYNGDMMIWQRGLSFPAVAARQYTADRWQVQQAGGALAVSRSGIGGSNSGSTFAMIVQRPNGNAVVAPISVAQTLFFSDFPQAYNYPTSQGGIGSLCFSVYLQAAFNFSPTNGNVTIQLIGGTKATAIEDNVLAGFTGATVLGTTTAAVGQFTNQRFFCIAPQQTTTVFTQLGVIITWTPTGTAGVADSLIISNAQLEIGSSPTGFEQINPADQLDRCQYTYENSFFGNPVFTVTTPAQNQGTQYTSAGMVGKAGATTQTLFITYKKTKRYSFSNYTPQITLFNPSAANAQVRNLTGGTDHSASAVGVTTPNGIEVLSTGNAGGAVGDRMAVGWAVDADIA